MIAKILWFNSQYFLVFVFQNGPITGFSADKSVAYKSKSVYFILYFRLTISGFTHDDLANEITFTTQVGRMSALVILE